MNGPLWSRMLTLICAALLSFAGLATGQDEAATRRVVTPGAQVQINQVETSQFPKVVIFATVLKDGAPVPGLTGKDFRVREDEVDQEPLTVVPKLTPLSAVLTLDTSGSMKKRLPDAQVAAKNFLTTLQSQDKVHVIRFSRDVKTIYPLGVDRAAAQTAIDSTVARGDTALWDALYASVESLRDVAGRKAIILLSDGVDDDGSGKPLSKRSVADVLALARQVNVPVYAIGLGTELDELALKKVADETGALYLNAVEASELTRLYDSIGKQLAGQYTIYYTSNLPADGSEHRVQLKVSDSTSMKSYLPAATTASKPTSTPVAEEPAKAAPVEKVKRLPRAARTITVLKPAIALPAMKEIIVVAEGEADNLHAAIRISNAGTATKYDEPIRIPPDAKAEKFDVVWIPKEGRRLILVKDITFDQEHPGHEIRPEEYLGLVRLGGKDLPKPKAIYLAEAGHNKMTVRLGAAQEATKYGEDMPVPPGTYDLYIDVADEERLELVAEKLEVKAGRVTEVD
ncbi:MAG TPA: VWA domain-containing protein [Candidatus Binatia bacterium]|nr:VWA domain-containing protein [Candidatus Binatia bacterium]